LLFPPTHSKLKIKVLEQEDTVPDVSFISNNLNYREYPERMVPLKMKPGAAIPEEEIELIDYEEFEALSEDQILHNTPQEPIVPPKRY